MNRVNTGGASQPNQSNSQQAAKPQETKELKAATNVIDPDVLLKAYFGQRPGLSEDQQNRTKEIKDAGLLLCQTIHKLSPKSADQSAAFRQVREAVFSACEAIGLEEVGKS